jgi:hypothetical protein
MIDLIINLIDLTIILICLVAIVWAVFKWFEKDDDE